MVHSEQILISISTVQNLYKKVSHYIYGYIDFFFFKTTLVNDNTFYIVNVHLNNEMVLIPFWFPPVNGGLRGFLFNMHKNGVFGADVKVINTRF